MRCLCFVIRRLLSVVFKVCFFRCLICVIWWLLLVGLVGDCYLLLVAGSAVFVVCCFLIGVCCLLVAVCCVLCVLNFLVVD